jgi:hypothetical protein
MAGLKKGDANNNDSREEGEEACIIREIHSTKTLDEAIHEFFNVLLFRCYWKKTI